MRQHLARGLRWLADWLDPPVLPEMSAIEAQALVWVRDMAAMSASGEYKRHQVYARLLKAFPDTPHRHVSQAIERAVEAL